MTQATARKGKGAASTKATKNNAASTTSAGSQLIADTDKSTKGRKRPLPTRRLDRAILQHCAATARTVASIKQHLLGQPSTSTARSSHPADDADTVTLPVTLTRAQADWLNARAAFFNRPATDLLAAECFASLDTWDDCRPSDCIACTKENLQVWIDERRTPQGEADVVALLLAHNEEQMQLRAEQARDEAAYPIEEQGTAAYGPADAPRGYSITTYASPEQFAWLKAVSRHLRCRPGDLLLSLALSEADSCDTTTDEAFAESSCFIQCLLNEYAVDRRLPAFDPSGLAKYGSGVTVQEYVAMRASE